MNVHSINLVQCSFLNILLIHVNSWNVKNVWSKKFDITLYLDIIKIGLKIL